MRGLILFAMAALLCAVAFGDTLSGSCGINLHWVIDESLKTLTITGSGPMFSFSKTYQDRPPWLSYRDKFDKIIIQDGVTSVGDFAFDSLDHVTSVTIPNSIIFFGEASFKNCFKATSITLPSSVTTIKREAFFNCSGVKTIKTSNNLTIGREAFYNCSKLTSVELTGEVTLDSYVFGACNSLKEFKVTNLRGDVPSSLLINCRNVVSVYITGNIGNVKDYAFCNCSSLKDVTISNIDGGALIQRAFANCSSLTNVNIVGKIFYMDIYTFDNCTSLTELKLSFTHRWDYPSVYGYAIRNCPKLEKVTFIGPMGRIETGFYGCDKLKSFVVEGNATSISGFSECPSLEEIRITGYVESVYGNSFANLKNLKTVSFGSVRWIYGNLFGTQDNGCRGVSLYVKGSVESVNPNAFYNCLSLSSFEVGGSIGFIASKAFYGCRNLKVFTVLGSIPSLGDETFSRCDSLENMTIHGFNGTVPDQAFANCKSLKSITIEGETKTIGPKAFYLDESLNHVDIHGYESIEYSAFFRTNLTSFTFDDTLKTIAEEAFPHCFKLKEVVIPASVTKIGSKAFDDCRALSKVVFLGDHDPEPEKSDIFPGHYLEATVPADYKDEKFCGLEVVREASSAPNVNVHSVLLLALMLLTLIALV